MRRNIKIRRESFREQREFDKALRAGQTGGSQALPLADAPIETQRWQVAMFDLQRELKADLDTRIAVVQSLLRQVDSRIERLETLQAVSSEPSERANA